VNPFYLLAALLQIQSPPDIRTTVPLVVAPTTITDRNGRYIDGLTSADFRLLDRGRPQSILADVSYQPISLVIALASNDAAAAALAKVGKAGSTIEPLITGIRGEVAVMSYADRIRTVQPFTGDFDRVRHALFAVRAGGTNARMVDAAADAIYLLETRPPGRRRVLILIGESKDRGSETGLEDVLTRAQRANVLIYPLTYSPWATPFTARPQDAPQGAGGLNLVAIFKEIARLSKENTAAALARYTGGRVFSFLKQTGLEDDLTLLGEELHAQYMLTFTPREASDGLYHAIEVSVPGRPDAVIRSRPGYWLEE
jgi:VWFA-related protein